MFIIRRSFHTSQLLRCTVVNVDKNLLSKLRKSTGYSISHCKKALQLHDNDVQKSQKWLHDQAQAEGWAKATKLSGRSTKQGLLAILISKDRKLGTMLELNCETDFVARNQMFKDLLKNMTEVCLKKSEVPEGSVVKKTLTKDEVASITSEDGKTLADQVALSIGLLGENMALSRAVTISTHGTESELHAITHPMTELEGSDVILGRFGSMVILKRMTTEATDPHIMKHLCLQIIGMNPASVGEALPEETPEESSSSDESSESSSSSSDSCSSSDSSSESETEGDAEKKEEFSTEKKPGDEFLLQQRWLDDEDYSVAQVLKEANIEVQDFIRLEVGETSEEQSS